MLGPYLIFFSIICSFTLFSTPQKEVELKKILHKRGYFSNNEKAHVQTIYLTCLNHEEWQNIKTNLLKSNLNSAIKKSLSSYFTDLEKRAKTSSLIFTEQKKRPITPLVVRPSKSKLKDVKNTPEQRGIALIRAIQHSNQTRVEQLLDQTDPNYSFCVRPGVFLSALEFAVERLCEQENPTPDLKHYAIVLKLLEKGARPTLYTARLVARSSLDKKDFFSLLLSYGFDFKKIGKSGITLSSHLLSIISDNEIEFAHFLIEQGADVNVMVKSKRLYRSTLLELKLHLYQDDSPERLNMIHLLVENGATINKNIFHQLVDHPRIREKMALARYFVDHGALEGIAATADFFEKQQRGLGEQLLEYMEAQFHRRAEHLRSLDDYERLAGELQRAIGFDATWRYGNVREITKKIENNFITTFAKKALKQHFFANPLSIEEIFLKTDERFNDRKFYPWSMNIQESFLGFYIDYEYQQIKTLEGELSLNRLAELVNALENAQKKSFGFNKFTVDHIIIEFFNEFIINTKNVLQVIDFHNAFTVKIKLNSSVKNSLQGMALMAIENNLKNYFEKDINEISLDVLCEMILKLEQGYDVFNKWSKCELKIKIRKSLEMIILKIIKHNDHLPVVDVLELMASMSQRKEVKLIIKSEEFRKNYQEFIESEIVSYFKDLNYNKNINILSNEIGNIFSSIKIIRNDNLINNNFLPLFSEAIYNIIELNLQSIPDGDRQALILLGNSVQPFIEYGFINNPHELRKKFYGHYQRIFYHKINTLHNLKDFINEHQHVLSNLGVMSHKLYFEQAIDYQIASSLLGSAIDSSFPLVELPRVIEAWSQQFLEFKSLGLVHHNYQWSQFIQEYLKHYLANQTASMTEKIESTSVDEIMQNSEDYILFNNSIKAIQQKGLELRFSLRDQLMPKILLWIEKSMSAIVEGDHDSLRILSTEIENLKNKELFSPTAQLRFISFPHVMRIIRPMLMDLVDKNIFFFEQQDQLWNALGLYQPLTGDARNNYVYSYEVPLFNEILSEVTAPLKLSTIDNIEFVDIIIHNVERIFNSFKVHKLLSEYFDRSIIRELCALLQADYMRSINNFIRSHKELYNLEFFKINGVKIANFEKQVKKLIDYTISDRLNYSEVTFKELLIDCIDIHIDRSEKNMEIFTDIKGEIKYFENIGLLDKKDVHKLLSHIIKKVTIDQLEERLNHDHKPPLLLKDQGTCSICWQDDDLWPCLVQSESCSGRLCDGCLEKFIGVAVKDAQQGQIPACSGCATTLKTIPALEIHQEMARSFARLREAIMRTRALQEIPDWQFCRTSDCFNGASFEQDEKRRFDCGACFFAGCLECGHNHSGCKPQSCDFLLEYGRKKPPEKPVTDPDDPHFYDGRYRPCAECGVMTERSQGCNGMKCSQCGTKWHWNEGLKSERHDSSNAKMNYEPKKPAHF